MLGGSASIDSPHRLPGSTSPVKATSLPKQCLGGGLAAVYRPSVDHMGALLITDSGQRQPNDTLGNGGL